MGTVRIRIFNRRGSPLDELVADATRSWKLNDIGTCKLKLARTDSKAIQKTLAFGNLILIESSEMPQLDWGGFIWPPRQWSEDVIEIEGQSGEGLLRQRAVITQLEQQARSSGALFVELMREANRREELPIEVSLDDVEDIIPKVFEDTFYGLRVYDAIDELRKRADYDWWFKPTVSLDNQLVFQAHWKRRRGSLGHQMVMNYNVIPGQQSVLTEDGDPVSAVFVLGQGETLETAPFAYLEDEDITRRYGLREMAFSGNYATQEAVEGAAKSFLTREGRIKRYYSVDAPFIPNDPLLSTIRLGSVHELFVGDYGFTEEGIEARTTVRVKGIALAEKEGKVSLVVQALRDEWDYLEK